MKPASIVSLFLIISVLINASVFGQDKSVTAYRAFSPTNSSCELIDTINSEFSSTPEFRTLVTSERERLGYIHSQAELDTYLQNFNKALFNARQEQEAHEFLNKSGGEGIKGAVQLITTIFDYIPAKFVAKTLSPIVNQATGLVVDKYVGDQIAADRGEMDTLIRSRINLLFSDGVDVTGALDEQNFANLFSAAHDDIPALNRDDYPVFNKELIKYAYQFTKDNRDQIKLLNLKETQDYEKVLADTKAGIAASEARITKNVTQEFAELGKSIAILSKNQEQIVGDLDSIRKHVESNEKRIATLEAEMVTFKDDLTKLSEVQAEHARLISQNSLQISVLSAYVFDNLPPTAQLAALKRGDFDDRFENEAAKQELIQKLERQTTVDTIGRTGAMVSQNAGDVFQFAVNTGALKGEDAQRVGKFLKYAIAAGNIISGGAKVYNGDPSGIFNIISGVNILLQKPPDDSPEFKLLKQMYTEMERGFDHLDKRLDQVDRKLGLLSEQIFEFQKSVLNSLQIIAGQLDRIDYKEDVLIEMSRASLFAKYGACKTVESEHSRPFGKYSDYKEFYDQPAVGTCLSGIYDIAVSDSDLFFQMKTLINNNTGLHNVSAEFELNELYKKTREMFARLYGSGEGAAIPALMYPSQRINDSNLPLFFLKKSADGNLPDSVAVLANYFSAELVNQYASLFLSYFVYFEVFGNLAGDKMKPLAIDEYLSLSNDIKRDRNLFLVHRLEALLNITDYAIAQQSILAGNLLIEPLYSILFTNSGSDDAKRAALDLLQTNKLLGLNFASYLLYKNLRLSESPNTYKEFVELFEGVGLPRTRFVTARRRFPEPFIDPDEFLARRTETLAAVAPADQTAILNGFVPISGVTFRYDSTNKRIYLNIARAGKDVDLTVPDLSTLPLNQMQNTSSLVSLLRTRKLLANKLVDLAFARELASDDSSLQILKYSFVP